MDKLWADSAAAEEDLSDGGEAEPEPEPERDELEDVISEDEDTEGAGEAAPLDADACSPQQVIARIEAVTAELATALLAEIPTVPALEMQATGSSGVTNKNLLSKRDAASTVRLWRVLAELHANLLAGRTATQRELYYAIVDGKSVKSATEVNTAILDAARLLRVPRAYLGVTCASRGCVTGSLSIREDSGMWVDLAGGTGRAIPGDTQWIAKMVIRSNARYVLVVEKDAVFNRLMQEGICQQLQLIMITARGQPDLATRAFVNRVAELLPDAPVLALVDFNPSGVLILSTYRQGGKGRHAMEERYNVNVRWLAARSADVAHIHDDAMQPLSARDQVLLRNMQADARFALFAHELQAMEGRGKKAELEALYDAELLLINVLTPKILRGDYL